MRTLYGTILAAAVAFAAFGDDGNCQVAANQNAAIATGTGKREYVENGTNGQPSRSMGRVETCLDGCDWRLDGVPVLVPNAWNKIDGADGCPGGGPVEPDSASATSYARRRGVYSRTLPAKKENRRYFIRCDGARKSRQCA